jgi:hypothetical protein
MPGRISVAVTAASGLAAMWVFPAPLLWGVLIGGLCLLAIVVAGFGWAASRVYDTVAGRVEDRRRRQRLHRMSGIQKRAGAGVTSSAEA